MSAKTISVRPAQRVESKIVQLARDLDKSPGQLLADAAEAIVDMVEAPIPRIPRIVRVARTLRQHDATFTSEERPFEIIETPSLRVAEEPPDSKRRKGKIE